MKTKEEVRNEFFEIAKRKFFEVRLILEMFSLYSFSVFLSIILVHSEVVVKHQLPFALNYFPVYLVLVVCFFLYLKQKTITKISEIRIKKEANRLFFERKEGYINDLKEISRERIELDNEEKDIIEELKILEKFQDEFLSR